MHSHLSSFPQLLHLVYQRWRKGLWPSLQVDQLLYRGIGVVLALTGLMLFGLLQTKDNYKVWLGEARNMEERIIKVPLKSAFSELSPLKAPQC